MSGVNESGTISEEDYGKLPEVKFDGKKIDPVPSSVTMFNEDDYMPVLHDDPGCNQIALMARKDGVYVTGANMYAKDFLHVDGSAYNPGNTIQCDFCGQLLRLATHEKNILIAKSLEPYGCWMGKGS